MDLTDAVEQITAIAQHDAAQAFAAERELLEQNAVELRQKHAAALEALRNEVDQRRELQAGMETILARIADLTETVERFLDV